MKRRYLLFGILVLVSLVLVACQPAAQPTEAPQPTEPPPPPTEAMEEEPMLPDLGGREVTIAVENGYLPFNYINPNTGVAEGWDYDFINLACERLNCTPVYVEFAWDPMIASVAEGQFDMAADGITITEERAQVVDFSIGYAPVQQRLLVQAGEDRFENIEDFVADEDAILGVQIGTTNYAVATRYLGDDRIITFDGFGETVQSLVNGDTDGVIIDAIAGEGYISANKDALKLVGPSLSDDELGFIFPKGSDLVEAFNAVIEEFKTDGTMAQLEEKWFTDEFRLTYDDIFPEEETAIGSEDNPIKVLYVPSVDATDIIAGGELLDEFLTDVTGLAFEVSVPSSYAATIEEMCASPDTTMGFIPGLGYVLGNQLCGIDVSLKATRFGYDWYAAMVVVSRDSDIQSLEDLNGRSWAYPDATSTSGYLYPLYLFQQEGVTPGETVEAGGHTGSIRAVYNDEVDFATAFYSPPNFGEDPIVWDLGDDPEIPAEFIELCALTEDEDLFCGDWNPRDARRNLRREAPDVIQKLRILAVTPKITNDTLSFGPEFPDDLRAQIVDALVSFATDDPDGFAEAMAAYDWTSVSPASDEDYDDIRLAVAAADFTLEDLGQ